MLQVIKGSRTTILVYSNTTVTIRCMCMNFILTNKDAFLHESTIVDAEQAGANGMLIACMLVEILNVQVIRECLIKVLLGDTIV